MDAPTPVVTRADIARALGACGVAPGDVVLIHSSLKRFGYVEGGPKAVIAAAQDAIGPDGTVVFPTLVQRDFQNAYKNWDRARTPSDVGLITEVFRTLPGSLRSDQATHSVAAQGPLADEITREHTAYGPRMGVFGDDCFAHSSPWQKMYTRGAKVVFMGVGTVYNTFKHFAEYVFVERLLAQIPAEADRRAALQELARFDKPSGAWPFHDAEMVHAHMDAAGLVTYSACGGARFTCIRADQYVDAALALFGRNPPGLFNDGFRAWLTTHIKEDWAHVH